LAAAPLLLVQQVQLAAPLLLLLQAGGEAHSAAAV
jgi:hypothetical protein